MEIQNLRGGVGREHRDLPADHVGDGLADALVGHHHDLEAARQLLEIFTRDMGDRAGAGRPIGQPARIGLGVGDQFCKRAHRDRRIDHDRGRAVGEHGDRRKILDRVVGRIGHDRRDQDVGRRAAEQNAVAVGR